MNTEPSQPRAVTQTSVISLNTFFSVICQVIFNTFSSIPDIAYSSWCDAFYSQTVPPLCFSSGRPSLWPIETWREAVMWIVAVGSTSMLLFVAQMASHISTPAWRDAALSAMTAPGWVTLHVFLEMLQIFRTAQIISDQDIPNAKHWY